MDLDIYLNLISKLIENNLIKSRYEIGKFIDNKSIEDKNIIKKKINQKIIVIPIKLENNKKLLVEDIPINFFFQQSILIGINSKLVEFENENKEIIICENSLFKKIKEEKIFEIKKLKSINPKKLHNIKFEKPNLNMNILDEINDYCIKIKKINLNKLHIIESNKIENFCPNVKQKHFKIAKDMNIPIIEIVENNFIKKSTINIKNEKENISKLNPLFIFEKEINWDFEKSTNKKVYKDLKKELIIDLENNFFENKINQIPKSNILKNEILKEIKDKKILKITDKSSLIEFPIFKNLKNQKYFKINDLKNFKEFSGLNFELDFNFLNNIFLQSLEGDKLKYQNKKLKYNIYKIIKKINISNFNINKKLKYNKLNELIIKLILFSDIKSIEKEEKLNKNQLFEIEKIIKFLLNKTIIKSILENKIPEIKDSNDLNILNKYLLSKSNSLNLIYEKYKNSKSKTKLLKKIIKEIQKMIIVLKNQKLEFENLFYLNQIILILIKIYKEFEFEKGEQFKNKFISYFKDSKIKIKKSIIDNNFEEEIESIAITNKISKKRKIQIIIIKEFNLNLLKKEIMILKKIPDNKIIKINNKIIKNDFPYSYNKIIFEIKKINPCEINKIKTLKIENKNIMLKKNYYKIYNEYKNYKIILKNQFFFLAIKKPESISNNFTS